VYREKKLMSGLVDQVSPSPETSRATKNEKKTREREKSREIRGLLRCESAKERLTSLPQITQKIKVEGGGMGREGVWFI